MRKRRDQRAEWVEEALGPKAMLLDLKPDPKQPEANIQYQYMSFDVRAGSLSSVLSLWGRYGWRCHTNSPNQTANGIFNGTVWILLERMEKHDGKQTTDDT